MGKPEIKQKLVLSVKGLKVILKRHPGRRLIYWLEMDFLQTTVQTLMTVKACSWL